MPRWTPQQEHRESLEEEATHATDEACMVLPGVQAIMGFQLMPGPTETDFFERAELTDTKLGQSKKDDPADVARIGSRR